MVHLRIGSEERTLSWEDWEARVRAGRVPPEALVRIDAVTEGDWVRADSLESFRDLVTSSVTAIERTQATAGPPLATAFLVGLQVRIWWVARLPEAQDWLKEHWTKWASPILEDAEVWRLLTMGVLHIDLAHALMNLLWLAYVGAALERALGWRTLVTLYVAAVTGGSLLSTFFSPDALSLGASGGVFGLIAAAVVFGFVRPELLPARSRRYFGFALLPYLLIMFVNGLMSGTTDNWAHLGGLLTGGVLALVADPEGFERREGWNHRWRLGTAGAVALVLTVAALLGPRIIPLHTEAEARAAALARRRPGVSTRVPTTPSGPVEASVPAGWTSGRLLTGEPGWTAPLAERGWSVRERRHEAPVSAEALLDAWEAELVEDGWRITRLEDGPDELAARPAHTRDVRLEGTPSLRLRHTVAAAGTRSLSAVWQVEEARAARLAPLAARLHASVAWSEPEALVEARARHARAPDAPAFTRRYADELARAGRGHEAAALLLQRVESEDASRADHVALLGVLAWYPDAIATPREAIATTLDLDLGPDVLLAAARAVAAQDDPALAGAETGLVELGWWRAPGEITLGSWRRRHGRSTALAPGGTEAATAAWARRTWWPDPPAPEASPDLSTAVRVAAARSAWRAERVVEVSAATGLDRVAPLVFLRDEHPAADPSMTLDLLVRELRAASEGHPLPPWWEEGLPDPAELLGEIDQPGAVERVPAWP